MNNLQNTETICTVCGGAGYIFDTYNGQLIAISHECTACDGTGLSSYGQAIENFQKVGICKKCDRPMVHYRLRGYKCPYCDDKD